MGALGDVATGKTTAFNKVKTAPDLLGNLLTSS